MEAPLPDDFIPAGRKELVRLFHFSEGPRQAIACSPRSTASAVKAGSTDSASHQPFGFPPQSCAIDEIDLPLIGESPSNFFMRALLGWIYALKGQLWTEVNGNR
jgi:hypothetical protein